MTLTYRAIWPIEDDSRPTSALIAEAAGAVDAMARADGARIVGTPRWTIAGHRLVCDAPAVALPDQPAPVTPERAREQRDTEVLRLAGLGWTQGQISATTGVARSTVHDILRRAGRLPAPESESEER